MNVPGVNPKIETRKLGTLLVKWKDGLPPKTETNKIGDTFQRMEVFLEGNKQGETFHGEVKRWR
jgi:hypothetical protein